MSIDDELRIEHDDGGGTDRWRAYIRDERVASFAYTLDGHGRMWLADAETSRAWQRRGVGRRMIAAAVDFYGEVWASTASRMEETDDDSRHLSVEGAALLSACVRDGIMKPSWVRNPYVEDLDADDDER